MASKTEHQSKWFHNRQFVKSVPDTYADWMVTVMFYASLHAVEVLFAHDGTRTYAGHTDRNQTLKSVNRYKQIWANYRPLFDASRTARYDPTLASWLPVERVKTQLVKHLYALEQSVLRLTGMPNDLVPIW
jgi:hypothetical protein